MSKILDDSLTDSQRAALEEGKAIADRIRKLDSSIDELVESMARQNRERREFLATLPPKEASAYRMIMRGEARLVRLMIKQNQRAYKEKFSPAEPGLAPEENQKEKRYENEKAT